jgi:hypothetical protein
MNLHKCKARPYLIAALRAIRYRESVGGTTTLSLFRAHTGQRDKPSVGNAEADHMAKWQALQTPEDPTDSSLDLLQNELPFILNTVINTTHESGRVTTALHPIHDSIPDAIRTAHTHTLHQLRKERPKRGELPRLHPRGTLTVIDKIWKRPTSGSILFMLETLTQFTPKSYAGRTPVHLECTRCGLQTPADPLHRTVTCPTIAHLWNTTDTALLSYLYPDFSTPSNYPTPLTSLTKTLNELATNLPFPKSLTMTTISLRSSHQHRSPHLTTTSIKTLTLLLEHTARYPHLHWPLAPNAPRGSLEDSHKHNGHIGERPAPPPALPRHSPKKPPWPSYSQIYWNI